LVEERRKVLGTGVLYGVSERAKALIQLAAQGLECLSMPAFFHGLHDMSKSYALAIGRPRRPAHQDRTTAQEALARRQGRPHADDDAPETPALVAARHAEGQHWAEGQHT
jgi:hypothetical protein